MNLILKWILSQFTVRFAINQMLLLFGLYYQAIFHKAVKFIKAFVGLNFRNWDYFDLIKSKLNPLMPASNIRVHIYILTLFIMPSIKINHSQSEMNSKPVVDVGLNTKYTHVLKFHKMIKNTNEFENFHWNRIFIYEFFVDFMIIIIVFQTFPLTHLINRMLLVRQIRWNQLNVFNFIKSFLSLLCNQQVPLSIIWFNVYRNGCNMLCWAPHWDYWSIVLYCFHL